MITNYLTDDDKILLHKLLEEDYEVCGHVINHPTLKDKYTLYFEAEGNSSGRAMCQHIKYSFMIWHTHPQSSKGYPSMEDIRKILQRKEIKFSFIFTSWGVWELSSGIKGNVPVEMQKEITELGDWLYRKTNRGRALPTGNTGKSIISKYIENLQNLSTNWRLNIKFNKKI